MKTKQLLLGGLLIAAISTSCSSVQDKDKQAAEAADMEGMPELVYEAATASDTLLLTENMVETHFVRLPDTPQGYRAQALLDILSAKEEEQILPFVYEHYAPDFIDQVPQAEHKELLQLLQQQIESAEVASVEELEHVYRIGLLNAAGNKEFVLDIAFQPEAPYKISGVRVL